MAKIRCRQCRSTFSSKQAWKQHLRAKHPGDWRLYQLKVYGGGGVLAVGLVAALVAFFSAQGVLPPTSFAGPHVEIWPDVRISSTPIPISQQKHIVEHVPGGRPGVLLQYNCEEFECEPDLVERLAEIALQYPNVYMAPYPGMSAKIAVSALSAQLVLEELDEAKIVEFIESR